MTDLAVGQLIGDYEVLSVAGTGGMGVVYEARQRALDRVVALKVILAEIARTPEYRERFLREARLAASVDHPHVVSVYEVIADEEHLALAMQWIDGEDLRHMIDRSGRLEPERAVAVVSQLAGALDAVHGTAGLVHRDVKPGNVLVRQVGGQDHAYLTDFGVAKPSGSLDQLTKTGWVVGTTGYLSPEQIRGQDPGPRSDLYALGCLFFEALTGQPPFQADNELALRWAHANDPRPVPSTTLPRLGTRYDQFVLRALAVEPQQRFASGREFAEALAQAHSGTAPTAQAAGVAVPHSPTAVGPPTPLPPQGPHTPVPSYGYQTPVPATPARGRSGNPLALIVLGLVALAGIAVGALAAAGIFSHHNSTQTNPAGQAAARKPALRSPAAAAPAGTTSCGGDLSVGPNTSCSFAHNVEQAYDQSSGGTTDVTANSPVTGQTYTMHCTAGSPHACTGGNNASVYFTSGPSSAPTAAPSSSGSGNTTACDQNISAGPGTSCPFAENVFRAYAADYKANGQQSTNTVTATSPVKNQAYSMNCNNDGTTVTCTGGNNALVTFPFHAVQVY